MSRFANPIIFKYGLVSVSFLKKNSRLIGRLEPGPMSWVGYRVWMRVSASFQIILRPVHGSVTVRIRVRIRIHLEGRLGPGPRVEGRLGSLVCVSNFRFNSRVGGKLSGWEKCRRGDRSEVRMSYTRTIAVWVVVVYRYVQPNRQCVRQRCVSVVIMSIDFVVDLL